MYHAPEYQPMDEDLAIDMVMRTGRPPPPPTWKDILMGLFWLSWFGKCFTPYQNHLMWKVKKRHEALCEEGKREH